MYYENQLNVGKYTMTIMDGMGSGGFGSFKNKTFPPTPITYLVISDKVESKCFQSIFPTLRFMGSQ